MDNTEILRRIFAGEDVKFGENNEAFNYVAAFNAAHALKSSLKVKANVSDPEYLEWLKQADNWLAYVTANWSMLDTVASAKMLLSDFALPLVAKKMSSFSAYALKTEPIVNDPKFDEFHKEYAVKFKQYCPADKQPTF